MIASLARPKARWIVLLTAALAAVIAFAVHALADGPQPSVGLYWFKSSDPTAGSGMNAPLYQLLIRTDVPSVYYKSGTANTAWTEIGSVGGGGGGGTVTSIACGTGLSCAPSPITTSGTINVSLTPTTCPAGQAEVATAANGTSTCLPFAPAAAIAGTANAIAKFITATTLGNSAVTDDGTTFAIATNKFTVTEASGNTAVAGTLTADGGARVLDAVVAGGGLALVANAVGMITSCSPTQVLAWSGAAWACSTPTSGTITGTGTANLLSKFTGASAIGNSSVGDDGTTFSINTNKFTVVEASGNTAVAGTLTADTGLRVFDAVSAGGGLTSTANAVGMITSCSATQVLAWSGAAWACASVGTGTVTGTGTANLMAKFTSASAIGNSSVGDDGTTFSINTNKLTVVEASGNTSIAGTLLASLLATFSAGVTSTTGPNTFSGVTTFQNAPAGATGAYTGTYSEWNEEFLNLNANTAGYLGGGHWTVVVSGTGATTALSGTTTRPGIWNFSSGTQASSRATLASASTTNSATGGQGLDFGSITSANHFAVFGVSALNPDAASGTATYTIKSGFISNFGTNNENNGCYFIYDHTNILTNGTNTTHLDKWSCWCAAGGTRTTFLMDGTTVSDESFTTVNAPVAVYAAPSTNINNLRVTLTSSAGTPVRAEFFVNNVKSCDINHNLPSGTSQLFGSGLSVINGASGTTAYSAITDFMHEDYTLSAARTP